MAAQSAQRKPEGKIGIPRTPVRTRSMGLFTVSGKPNGITKTPVKISTPLMRGRSNLTMFDTPHGTSKPWKEAAETVPGEEAFRFLDLPREVRFMIYPMVLTHYGCSHYPTQTQHAYGYEGEHDWEAGSVSIDRLENDIRLQFLMTCTTIYQEGYKMYYQMNLFRAYSSQSLFDYLNTKAPPAALANMTTVQFKLDGRGGYVALLALQTLPSLQKLIIDIDNSVFHPRFDRDYDTFKTEDDYMGAPYVFEARLNRDIDRKQKLIRENEHLKPLKPILSTRGLHLINALISIKGLKEVQLKYKDSVVTRIKKFHDEALEELCNFVEERCLQPKLPGNATALVRRKGEFFPRQGTLAEEAPLDMSTREYLDEYRDKIVPVQGNWQAD